MDYRIVAVALVTLGCAGQQGGMPTPAPAASASETTSTRRGCAPATDSTFGLAIPVYRACAVDREARAMDRRLSTDFRPTSPATTCYRAIVEFVVDEKGQTMPATTRIVRSTDSQYARAVVEAVARWRFTPASKGGTAVAQVVQIDQWIEAMVRMSGQPAPPPPSRPSC